MDNYITLFEKFIGLIDWKLLQSTAVKLNTDYKVRSFFTHHHLASMIYFHVCEHDGLRHLSQSVQDNLKDILPTVSTATLSHHNNSRDFRVFVPIMNDLIKIALQTLTKDERLAKFGSTGIPDRVIFSNAVCHDRTKMDELMTDKGTIYICDKGSLIIKSLILIQLRAFTSLAPSKIMQKLQ